MTLNQAVGSDKFQKVCRRLVGGLLEGTRRLLFNLCRVRRGRQVDPEWLIRLHHAQRFAFLRLAGSCLLPSLSPKADRPLAPTLFSSPPPSGPAVSSQPPLSAAALIKDAEYRAHLRATPTPQITPHSHCWPLTWNPDLHSCQPSTQVWKSPH